MASRKLGAIPADPAEYRRVVARVRAATARWPNAYASGRVVQEYKAAMAAKGLRAYLGFKPRDAPLARWYSEDWVDVSPGLPCGAARAAAAAAPWQRFLPDLPAGAAGDRADPGHRRRADGRREKTHGRAEAEGPKAHCALCRDCA